MRPGITLGAFPVPAVWNTRELLFILQSKALRAGEIAHWLRTFVAEDPG